MGPPTSQNGNSDDTITNYIRSLFDFNRARTRLVLGKWQENVRNTFTNFSYALYGILGLGLKWWMTFFILFQERVSRSVF